MKQYIKPVGIILLVCGIIALLAACATLTTTISTICDNREIVQDQAERQISSADDITDPTKRAAVLAIASFTLAALEKCPKRSALR